MIDIANARLAVLPKRQSVGGSMETGLFGENFCFDCMLIKPKVVLENSLILIGQELCMCALNYLKYLPSPSPNIPGLRYPSTLVQCSSAL